MAEKTEKKQAVPSKQLSGDYVLKDPTGGFGSVTPAAIDFGKLKRISRPPFVKPLELPEGWATTATILDVVETNAGTRKGKPVLTKSLHLRNEKGIEVLFPISTTMETHLGDKPEQHKGKTIGIRVLPAKTSGQFKKRYFNCEVFLSEK